MAEDQLLGERLQPEDHGQAAREPRRHLRMAQALPRLIPVIEHQRGQPRVAGHPRCEGLVNPGRAGGDHIGHGKGRAEEGRQLLESPAEEDGGGRVALVHHGLIALAEEALVLNGAELASLAQERVAVLVEDGEGGEIESHVEWGDQNFQKCCRCSKATSSFPKASHSARLTARKERARSGPSAFCSIASRSRRSRAAVNVVGKRSMRRAERSAAEEFPGSTMGGSGGSRERPTPASPAASSPPRARYGLAEASHALSSALVEPARSEAKVEGIRTAPSRLSGPHAV